MGTVNPDDIFRKEAWDYFRSARTEDAPVLQASNAWIRGTYVLLVAIGMTSCAFLVLGQATDYGSGFAVVASGTASANNGRVTLLVPSSLVASVRPGDLARLVVPEDAPVGQPGTLGEVRVGSSADQAEIPFSPRNGADCVRKGACIVGAHVRLEIPRGGRSLLSMLLGPD